MFLQEPCFFWLGNEPEGRDNGNQQGNRALDDEEILPAVKRPVDMEDTPGNKATECTCNRI